MREDCCWMGREAEAELRAEEHRAKERLRNAAPELLAVARGLIAWRDNLSPNDPGSTLDAVIRAARAAIAKAEAR